jgi:hypothetical protein
MSLLDWKNPVRMQEVTKQLKTLQALQRYKVDSKSSVYL